MKSIVRFLGSVSFAVFLIASSAVMVIVGTLVESWTNSHLLAAQWTYQHPLFVFLLLCFFLNIFISALLRWPFKKKHFPFLITHLGLLMVIVGIFIKNQWGLQGHMILWEGSGNDRVLIPHTHSLAIEKKGEKEIAFVPVPSQNSRVHASPTFPQLKCKILHHCPHAETVLSAWKRGNYLQIFGVPPLPIQPWNPSLSFPDGILSRIARSHPEAWRCLALQTEDKEEAVDFLRKLKEPTLLFVINQENHIFVIASSDHTILHEQRLDSPSLQSYLSYDEGFKGYTVQVSLPIPNFPCGTKEKMRIRNEILTEKLREMVANSPFLIPPLHWFQEECRILGIDFPKTFVEFLSDWKEQGTLFAEESRNKQIDGMEWDKISFQEKKGCQWIYHLLKKLEPFLKEEPDLKKNLERLKWPLPIDSSAPFSLFDWTQQIFAYSPHFPPPFFQTSVIPSLFSCYLMAYGIDFQTFFGTVEEKQITQELKKYWKTQPFWKERELQEHLILESELFPSIAEKTPPTRPEDQTPAILLEISEGNKKERIALSYDPTASGLKWPVLEGKYKIRFQPEEFQLPYRLRLREARQIDYPDSSQPYSYECDLVIKERVPKETTLSMNQVYETLEGYRFYLSGIGFSHDRSIKRVQLAINKDPAKYFLTYPGGMLVCLGACLLFIRKRKNTP